MKDVSVDVVSSDRLPEMREAMTVAFSDGAECTIRRQAELNVPDAWTTEELDAIRKAADADMRTGMYTRVNIHNFIAFKP